MSQATQPNTTRRSIFGGLALAAGAAAVTALPAIAAPADNWAVAIAGAEVIDPRMAAALRHAKAAGFTPGQMDFMLTGSAWRDRDDFPRIRFNRDDGTHEHFCPRGIMVDA